MCEDIADEEEEGEVKVEEEVEGAGSELSLSIKLRRKLLFSPLVGVHALYLSCIVFSSEAVGTEVIGEKVK